MKFFVGTSNNLFPISASPYFSIVEFVESGVFRSSLVCLLFSIVGCSEKLPDNFPKKLTNFTVTLLHENKSVEGAAVTLFPEDMSVGYYVTAFTNSNGTAILETSVNKFSKSGVPAGTYKLIITHIPKTSVELTKQEVMTLSNDELRKREDEVNTERNKLPHPVPKNWSDLKSTPLKITVPEKGGNITIEITDSKTFVQ
jgi:hypothetical protein